LSISFAASTARADASVEEGAREERPTSAIAFSMGPTMSWPRTSRLTLGPLAADGARKSGGDLALGTPTLAGGELSAFYVRRYISLGLTGTGEGTVVMGADATPSSPPSGQARSLVHAESLERVGGAFEVDANLPLGRARVSIGARSGVVAYAIATTLVATCGSLRNGDQHPCAATAWSPVYAVLEPRVRVSVPILEAALWIDGSAGYDLVTGGPSVGLSLRFQFPLGANASYRLAP
jgi:hypothetical protein